MAPGRKPIPLADRLWAKVDKSGDCWLWTGYCDRTGYGRIGVGRGIPPAIVHRVAYELVHGPIPEGLEIDHLCRVRNCCNPAHLEAVTHHVNIRRGTYATKALCVHGHPLSGDNLDRHSLTKGHRRCRECARAAGVRRYEAKAEQPVRHYQRRAIRGKGLTVTLYPALRARIEAAAAKDNTSLSAIIVAVLTEKFLGKSEEDDEAAK